MAKRYEVYKCEICGNIVMVLHGGKGELVCCKQPMVLLKENEADPAVQKHVPVLEKKDGGIKVKVGSVPHPMEEKHHIEWIEVLTESGSFIKFLNPGDKPEAEFVVEDAKYAREYCTLHGLWKSS